MTQKDETSTKDEPKVEKSQIALEEETILDFWNKNKIFEKTLDRKEDQGEFVFYDGPPFATGLPHAGHMLPSSIKDIFPRFQTMLGKHVRRQWGWDCHGLPIENLIEKELGLDTKKDIEELGIEKFNKAAHDSVLRYEVEWAKTIPRVGRWVDMENKYQTMDPQYTESIWWAFKNLYEKDLVYKGYKSMHLCPRCETTLSNFEVNQGYKDVSDLSVTAKFELVDEPGTFVLAWTTTPWTLPGNVALAVNPEIDYVKVKDIWISERNVEPLDSSEGKEPSIKKEEFLLVAKDLFEKHKDSFNNKEPEVTEVVKGSDLVGKSYKPLFDYYVNADLEGDKEAMFKIYGAEFVTTEDGTGIVHIAPAFGDDDMKLGQEHNLPVVQHVGTDGEFKPEVTDFKGKVKPLSDDDKIRFGADIEIIRYLQEHNTFFSKEKIKHSYPHCWRCDTPLLNYATTSWFIRVPELKDKLLSENAQVHWVPETVGKNRFGKWLEGARDWAVSRTRYWGAPLPVWECSECTERKIFGSMQELREATKPNNSYVLMRHAEAIYNTEGKVDSSMEESNHLTEVGKKQAIESSVGLQEKGIDLIIASPFVRTKETAEIVAKELGLSKDSIVFDDRIKELGMGEYDGGLWAEYSADYPDKIKRFEDVMDKGIEPFVDVRKRVGDFLFDCEQEYKGKNILIISHGGPVVVAHTIAHMATAKKAAEMYISGDYMYANAEYRDLDFVPFSHNDKYEMDFHKPYIDEVKISCDCGGEMKRVTDVFDCWFESGSMPFAQHHYPFENKDKFDPDRNIGFPADFIAEGLDQTRGWFYTLMAISVGLFGRSPYKNVLVNGLVLAEDGKKMSKRLKNYPDINLIFNKYGADAVRFYLVSSPVVRAEDARFVEKGIDEVSKKIIMRLGNVYSFYEMYADDSIVLDGVASDNLLDQWIITRFAETRDEVTNRLLSYELDKAARPFNDFIDDLSTWYLRRSRDRFKGADAEDKKKALATTKYILTETSKILAPFMPFSTEALYQKLKGDTDPESVHLCRWPEPIERHASVLELMAETRKAVTGLLDVRTKAGIKVRQPLAKGMIKNTALAGKDEYLSIIAEEVNAKEVVVDESIAGEFELDANITPELEDEGLSRDLIRSIQDARKKAGLQPSDMVTVTVIANDRGQKIAEQFKSEIVAVCGLSEIKFEKGEEVFGEVKVG